MFIIASTNTYAQEGTISGTVTDNQTGEPLPGVTVLITNTQRGVVTNIDGEYSIENIPFGSYTLRFSFVGYKASVHDIDLNQANLTLDVELRVDLIGLEDVIVTAQQIERESREIGTAITTVKGEEVTKARDSNLVNSLTAKVPGVEVRNQSGTIGGSSRIVIRGSASLTGDNQPLFVIDGVPVSNANTVAGTAAASRLSGGAVDVGNRAGDLNPDDIESISVLKGGSAAALYGQRARNGAIIITTKRGSDKPKASISINSSFRTSNPLVLPDYQNTFAQGDTAVFDVQNLNGWGPRIEGQTVTDWKGDEVSLQAFPDNVDDFFEGGLSTINSVSFSTADEISDFRLGITRFNEKGIVPGSELKRTNISVNTGRQLPNNVTTRISANYVFNQSENRTVQGGNDPNILGSIVMQLPRNISTSDMRNNVVDPNTGDQIALTNFTNNPFWIANNNGLDNDVERFFGSGQIAYEPYEWLKFSANVGTDFFTENRRRISAVGTLNAETGAVFSDRIQQREIDIDFIASFDRPLISGIDIKGNIGWNINDRRREIFSNTSLNLTVPDLFTIANARSNTPESNLQTQRIVGLYGDVTFSYNDYLHLNLTGRNDWSSTLPVENRSFFYPSANVSFIFTEAFNLDSDIFSYGKFRASISEVGSDEDPFQLDFRFFPITDAFGQFGTDIVFPFNGLTSFEATGTIPPTDLKPESTVTLEFGTELQFYDGRFGIDFTWYDEDTDDQIISIPIPESSGFSFRRTNVGEVQNQGIEVLLSINPIRSRTFNWSSTFNFSKNEQKVVSLAPGVEELIITSGFNGLQFKAKPGEEIGIFGNGWLRNENGDILIDGVTGLKIPGPEIRLGDQNPDFKLGINNTVRISNFDLSFLIDYSEGGTIVSETVSELRNDGLAIETQELREFIEETGEFIDRSGVVDNGDGTFRQNDVPVESAQAFFQNEFQGSVFEEQAFDASYVKLREVRLTYNLPRKWLDRTPFGNVAVGVEGRNLWLIHSNVPHIDPELNVFGSAINGQGVEFNTLPSVRTFGGNIRFTF